MSAGIRVGDIGSELVVAVTDEQGVLLNIAAASSMLIYLTRPDGITLTKTAVLDTTGIDGLMKYVTQAGDLSVAGTWQIEGRVAVGGARWSTDQATFTVFSSRGGV